MAAPWSPQPEVSAQECCTADVSAFLAEEAAPLCKSDDALFTSYSEKSRLCLSPFLYNMWKRLVAIQAPRPETFTCRSRPPTAGSRDL